MTYSLNRVVRRLQKDIDRESASSLGGDLAYQFRVAPSCPPDKRIHIRSGVPIPNGQWLYIVENSLIPDTICDFGNEDETQMNLVFTNAGYYLPIILCYGGDWIRYQEEDPIFDNVIGNEAVTVAEAETQIDGFLNGVEQWYLYRLPLCGVILKNNGDVGISCAIEPIDAVNRGRSYIYRDARSVGGTIA